MIKVKDTTINRTFGFQMILEHWIVQDQRTESASTDILER